MSLVYTDLAHAQTNMNVFRYLSLDCKQKSSWLGGGFGVRKYPVHLLQITKKSSKLIYTRTEFRFR